jgi:hypothetical protein
VANWRDGFSEIARVHVAGNNGSVNSSANTPFHKHAVAWRHVVADLASSFPLAIAGSPARKQRPLKDQRHPAHAWPAVCAVVDRHCAAGGLLNHVPSLAPVCGRAFDVVVIMNGDHRFIFGERVLRRRFVTHAPKCIPVSLRAGRVALHPEIEFPRNLQAEK